MPKVIFRMRAICGLKEISYNSSIYTIVQGLFTINEYFTFTKADFSKIQGDIVVDNGKVIFRSSILIKEGEEVKMTFNKDDEYTFIAGDEYSLIKRKEIVVENQYFDNINDLST